MHKQIGSRIPRCQHDTDLPIWTEKCFQNYDDKVCQYTDHTTTAHHILAVIREAPNDMLFDESGVHMIYANLITDDVDVLHKY